MLSLILIPKVTIPTAIVVFLNSLLLLLFFFFSHDFRLHRRSYLMSVLYKVIWPQTEHTSHRILLVPTNANFWSDWRLDSNVIFLIIIIINLKEREMWDLTFIHIINKEEKKNQRFNWDRVNVWCQSKTFSMIIRV